MSTLLEKKLAENVILNLAREKPLNKQQLVVSSGYKKISAKSSAHLILEQKGVKEELKKRGFDSDNAKNVVGDILDNEEIEPNVRLNAAREIFKVHGDYAPEKHENKNLNVNVDTELDQLIAEVTAQKLKERKTT